MRFSVTLGDGTKLDVDAKLPIVTLHSYRPVAPIPVAATAQRVAKGAAAVIAAQLEPYLPPGGPARKVVQRDEKGTITGIIDQPAMDPPAEVMRRVAERLVPALLAEYEPDLRAELKAQGLRTTV